jgi:aminodeoxyfutalosine synthase
MDAGLKRDLEQKVRAGTRLTREDGIALCDCDDLAWLGGLAHEVRTRDHGDLAFFAVSCRLALTGSCGASCVCASSRGDRGEPGLAALPVDEAVRAATTAVPDGLGALHLTGGLHPAQPWSCYPDLLRALKQALPQVCLTAFSAADIHHAEKLFGRPAADLLDELVDAGLDSFTDAGAETAGEEAPARAAGHGTRWEDYARIHRLAHGKGLRTPCGLLHGHTEEPRQRVGRLLRLRELQDDTGGFQVFAPQLPRCPRDPDGADRSRPAAGTASVTGAEALKTFAVSRLLFDNVPHIRASWVTHGVRTAQLALLHGADDADGPAGGHRTTDDAAGSLAPDGLTREDVLDLIRDAGFRPVERDSRYEAVRVYEGADPARRDVPQPMRV